MIGDGRQVNNCFFIWPKQKWNWIRKPPRALFIKQNCIVAHAFHFASDAIFLFTCSIALYGSMVALLNVSVKKCHIIIVAMILNGVSVCIEASLESILCLVQNFTHICIGFSTTLVFHWQTVVFHIWKHECDWFSGLHWKIISMLSNVKCKIVSFCVSLHKFNRHRMSIYPTASIPSLDRIQ